MGEGNFLTRMLFRPKTLLLFVAAIAIFAGYPTLLKLIPNLGQQEEYTLPAKDIVITHPEKWVPKDLLQQVLEHADIPETISLLDAGINKKIAQAFGQQPWVEEVVQVRKSLPARIEVELKYRSPAAMIAVPNGMYPVTAEGILLPPGDFTARDIKYFPVVRNVRSTPQGPAGTFWGDVAVSGAGKLASALAPYWREFDLMSIQLPASSETNSTIDELIFVLTTSGGSRIIWGRVPGSNYPGELTAETKIGKLKEYLSHFGAFDTSEGPSFEIDIRHWQETSRRPLSYHHERTSPRR